MQSGNGQIRVLIATNSASMGVNYRDVTQIIHYGPPCDMDSYMQQMGRAGRNPQSQAHSLIVFSNRQLRNVDPDMLAFIRNNGTCRREQICMFYGVQRPEIISHLCCDLCQIDCQCENCPELTHPAIQWELHSSDEEEASSATAGIRNLVTVPERQDVKQALIAYRESLCVRQFSVPNIAVLQNDTIARITALCHTVNSADDIYRKFDVPTLDIAKDIWEILCRELLIEAFTDSDDDYIDHDD